MPFLLHVNGVELCAETFGRPEDPALLLIAGAGGSMDSWDERFCAALARAGRLVIRYDQRDTGASSHDPPGAPRYGLPDLVKDALGLLDALRIERVHVVGLSMGGTVAMLMALDAPRRVVSLTLMSTSPAGPYAPDLPPPVPALAARFRAPPATPDWQDREATIAWLVDEFRAFAGPAFDAGDARRLAERIFDRTIDLAASMTNPALLEGGEPVRPRLNRIAAPTLVIHGTADPLFPFAHGEALAREIPGAELLPLPSVGHEAPPAPTWPRVVAALSNHTR